MVHCGAEDVYILLLKYLSFLLLDLCESIEPSYYSALDFSSAVYIHRYRDRGGTGAMVHPRDLLIMRRQNTNECQIWRRKRIITFVKIAGRANGSQKWKEEEKE